MFGHTFHFEGPTITDTDKQSATSRTATACRGELPRFAGNESFGLSCEWNCIFDGSFAASLQRQERKRKPGCFQESAATDVNTLAFGQQLPDRRRTHDRSGRLRRVVFCVFHLSHTIVKTEQSSPSGFMPVETRFENYKRTDLSLFRPPPGFMPNGVDLRRAGDVNPLICRG